MLLFYIKADFRPVPMNWDDGMDRAIEVLRSLSTVPVFSTGWQSMVRLGSDDAEFKRVQRDDLTQEDIEGGYYSVTVENSRGPIPPNLDVGSYVASIAWNRNEGYLNFDLGIRPELVTLDLIFETVTRLEAWSPLQHVTAGPLGYSQYDTPIDPVNRVGIGWAGWVPFRLTPEQVPEAAHLTQIGAGTFLASQETYWSTGDAEAVKRAQALELRLNGLGMLPTRRVLAQGTWGTAQP